MTVDEWPEWLPADWMIQIRKIDERKVKCYIDPEGRKFYSKPQVDRHIRIIGNRAVSEKTNNVDGHTLDLALEPEEDVPHTSEDPEPESTPKGQSTRARRTGSSSKNYKETEEVLPGYGSSSVSKRGRKQHTDTAWLPDGWSVEVKSKKSGQKYKIYIDPNGKKLFSKPQVLSYIAYTNNTSAGQKEGYKTPTQREKSQISEAKNETRAITDSTRVTPDYEVISSAPADGLPPGWIKEIRVKTNGFGKKRDPVPHYLDPLSGYIFFTKLDALRYLDSGDIKRCAIKPLRRDMSQEIVQIANEAEGELASPHEPTKETETPKGVENGSVVTESKTEGSATEKRKVRSITGDGYLPMPKPAQKEIVRAKPAQKVEVRSKSAQKDESWLPEGWVVEMKYRDNDKKIKCYKEIATGKNLYSKPQVLSYLGNGSSITPNTNTNTNSQKRKKGRKSYVEHDSSPDSGSDDVTRPKRSKKTKVGMDGSNYKETIVTTPAEGLPPGWIKEVRTRVCGSLIRKDPYYTDPVSGYIFRSRLDAMRYLEFGDINLCAMRPRKKDADGNEVAIPDARLKPKRQKQPFEGGSDMEGIDIDENTPGSTPIRRGTRERASKSKPAAATPLPARSSTRLKGIKPHTKTDAPLDGNAPQPDNGEVGEKEAAAGVDVEKQGGNEEQLDYQLEDDSSWTDQFDFAVKTLVGEFPPDENGGVGNGSSAKVN